MPTPKKPPANAKPAAAKPGIPKEAAKALAKVAPLLAKLDPQDLEPINVDIPRAVSIATAAVRHLNELRPTILAELPKWPIHNLDDIGTYGMAAWYAYLLTMPTASSTELSALLEEASPLREDLLVAAEALAHKGFLDPKSVKAIREGLGNLDKANDLVALSALFSREWDNVKNKTTVEWADVERAAVLGPQLLVALGERDQPGVEVPTTDDPAHLCALAYTLFVRSYDECRRAVSFLRWHQDDADLIAPSLFANRGRRAQSGASPKDTTPEPAGAPAAPSPSKAPEP